MRSLLLNLFFIFFCLHIQAATYYSRTSGGSWTTASTWSQSGYGGSASVTAPSTNDTVKVGDGYTVVMNATTSCAQLDLGQGTSGVVQYSSANSYTLTVGGNVTINAGASFEYTSNSSRTHGLSVGGNLTNNGTVNFYFDAND